MWVDDMNGRVAGAGVDTAAAHVPVADLAMKIALAMRALRIAPLPSNYRILHEVFAGTNPRLTADFSALGDRPRQKDLDMIGMRHFPAASGSLVVEALRDRMVGQIETTVALVRKENTGLHRFAAMLHEATEGLERRSDAAHDFLDRVASLLLVAAQSRAGQGRQLAAAFVERAVELDMTKARLEEYRRLVDIDPLTGLANRGVFDRTLPRLFGSTPQHPDAALILIDIDHFKRINDRLGHPAGDRVLRQVACAITASVPQALVVARAGGEEFAVILANASSAAALAAAESLRASVAGCPFEVGGRQAAITVTVSAGIAMTAQAAMPDELYARADRALYVSKASGRNRCTLDGPGS